MARRQDHAAHVQNLLLRSLKSSFEGGKGTTSWARNVSPTVGDITPACPRVHYTPIPRKAFVHQVMQDVFHRQYVPWGCPEPPLRAYITSFLRSALGLSGCCSLPSQDRCTYCIMLQISLTCTKPLLVGFRISGMK